MAIDEATFYQPIRTLAEAIRTRKLSVVELTEGYLDRLERYGPRLNAVATVMREAALREARSADLEIRAGRYRGLLHGIPYGAKDLLATRATPTTWGAAPFRTQVFDFDATVIHKLREAGAILIGKLAMVELAGAFGYGHADASFTGPGKNPWNVEFWAGGSSSGSGATVSAALVPFAIGSETSGSIITPAAYCGITGLRPTYGRVSRFGAMALSWTLDKLGPICRSADCTGIVLRAIAGRDAKDPTAGARTFTHPDSIDEKQRFRVGVLRECTQGIQPAVRENFERSLKVLSQFAEIVENVSLPDLPFGPVVGILIDAEGASAFRDLIESGRIGELRTASMKPAAFAASVTLAVDYLQALRVRVKMQKAMKEMVAKFDAIVAPSRTTVAYRIDRPFNESYREFRPGPPLIPAGNAVGQPALSVPNGFGPDQLPTGIQFTGGVWSEEKLIALARRYQRATDWHQRRPPLPRE